MRLAVVAGSLVLTVGVLLVITLQAQRAQVAEEDAAAQTLRDYAGYAGRMMGAEILRRFAEQRAAILAPVTTGNSRSGPPLLADIKRNGDAYFSALEPRGDTNVAYFRVEPANGHVESAGEISSPLAAEIADTVRSVIASSPWDPKRNLLVLGHGAASRSVALAALMDVRGKVSSVYGYTYDRTHAVSIVAARVFKETPLLPTSYTGAKWDYDTVWARNSNVGNDAFVAVRIIDRVGHTLWASDSARIIDGSPFRERVTIRTSPGGMIFETAMASSSEQYLIPTVVRSAQTWSTRALLALTVLLLIVSLVALQGERLGARERRAEAMQQLALGLRHEINNALASVLLNAELLREEETLDASQRERLLAMVEQLDRMRGVLRKLEKIDGLDVVPYLNEGYMVDLSIPDAPSYDRESGTS